MRTLRFAALPGLMAGALLGGCGTAESGPRARIDIDRPAAATPAPAGLEQAAPAPSVEAARLDRRLAVAEKAARRREAARAKREIDRVRRTADRRVARGNAASARRTAAALAEAMRYGTPGVVVTAGGRTVTVSVGRDRGCMAPASGPKSLAARVRAALPFVRDVAVVVERTPLAAWASAHCAFTQLPRVATVASANGSGAAETAPFHVGRGTWVVDYGTSGSFLEVLLMQDAEFLDRSSGRRGTGTGRIEFTGPGTYTLRVAGDGLWSIQVRRAG